MKRGQVAIAAGLLLAWPAMAQAIVNDASAEMRQYVRARLADAAGMPDAAAASYARLLQASPQDKRLALRTYRQALTAGNYKLAGLAAAQLDRLGALPPDGTLLLFAEAVTAHDWKRANATIGRIEREQVFGFLAPVMRGWVAYGRQAPDAARLAAPTGGSQLSNAYSRDHHLLIALAMGRYEMLSDLRRLVAAHDVRSLRLQLAAAALLAKRGDLANARGILEGQTPELIRARATLDAGKPLLGAIDTPELGLSDLFAQLAIDVKGDGRSPVSLQLARIGGYLAPGNAAAIIATADLLTANGYHDAALALLDTVPAEDPLWEAARQERSGILLSMGNRQAALADAQKAAAQPGASAATFVELGGILADLNRPAEAVKAYQRAIDIDTAQGVPNWAHLFLQAGALDRSGDWEGAKELLRQASKLAPGQAVILNYLGYGMLDRGENLPEAQAYIERASSLDPNDAAIADSLGWLYYKRGNYPGAIAALERAVAGEPGQSVINEHLGDAYWAVGRRMEARYAWRAALVQADKADSDRIKRKLADGPGDRLSAN
ncbi:tetratricopeptide repeat protein [Rhizorhabdus histidinilytica]|jgi:tetratricopeptide (TPR) repeat protein|nr:tetratricopeptide repeat protein [Rhizorhabdus histidinilytica]